MFKNYLFLIVLMLDLSIVIAQDEKNNEFIIFQTIRGNIIDSDAEYPLIGSNVMLKVGDEIKGATSDINGDYRIEDVPVGKYNIKASYLGYEDVVLMNIVVTSAKEVILNIELKESTQKLKTVEVKASRQGQALNEMAAVSSRAFTVEETDRYAGSRGDPARMASNFAGVTGADDSRNDIVIRGNSPAGVLYRVENVDIPNPNHFSIPGTGGGPASILNNKTLANSDFYTGAFPAEFGNSFAGIFDLRLRSGNNEKHEFSSQFGFLGTELFAEGPLSKKSGSSYLFSYRYSTLALFGGLGINIGTNAVPFYQDLTFKLNFKQKRGGSISIFGIGGVSDIDIIMSNNEMPVTDLYSETDKDQYFGSDMGIVGMSYKKPINKKTFVKATLAASNEQIVAHHDGIDRTLIPFVENGDTVYKYDLANLSLFGHLDYTFQIQKALSSIYLKKKFSPSSVMKIGINSDLHLYNFRDSIRVYDTLGGATTSWKSRWKSNESSIMLQPYIQWKYNLSDYWIAHFGIHSIYYSLTNSLALVEPRGAIEWNNKKGTEFSFGLGKHSQIQSPYVYFYAPENQLINNELGFTKSDHYVISFNQALSSNSRIKIESYYQYLYDVPVEVVASPFSILNSGSGFSRIFADPLKNSGVARNIGIEATIEKFFVDKFFFMLTASLYDSQYRGSDMKWRNTSYNGIYAINALASKELSIGDNALIIGLKNTMAGGRRYGDVHFLASVDAGETVYANNDNYNKFQFKDYFRLDMKINYKINRPKVTHEIALDLVNLTGYENILKTSFDPEATDQCKAFYEEYQLGFLPVFYYKIDF